MENKGKLLVPPKKKKSEKGKEKELGWQGGTWQAEGRKPHIHPRGGEKKEEGKPFSHRVQKRKFCRIEGIRARESK